MDLKSLVQSSESRVAEEQLYEIIAEELDVKKMRKGLWMKAFAQAKGDEALAQALYIDLRLQSLKDELQIYTKELANRASSNALTYLGSKMDRIEAELAGYRSDFKKKKVVVNTVQPVGYAVHLPDGTSKHAKTFADVLTLVEKIP